ncbi:MAG TPA: hypothetical protein VGP04_05465 [Pseudonocardiaceae bacterium]|nr:hypothetical protein [Pseudonocardiaceae bacterium]
MTPVHASSRWPGPPTLEHERHQPLLRAAMEVSLDPAASLVRRRDDPPARGGELGLAVRIRGRGCEELGELLEAFDGVQRQRQPG